ncbi:DUF4097 family beta strand repeat-containing protein [Salinirussus salinus]|uniref:DUF4097 family beta strand repeat-containing protein n=1 Tax=Salinirussus salinus TaxID=1198300 RepID=UPI00135822A3|nr:DUF4097 family beta strand repeat-containing protein [Salinirussus salinus]
MNKNVSRREVLAGCAAAASAGLAGCASGELTASAPVTDELAADGVTSLSVDVTNGDITVRDDQRQSVKIDGQKRAPSEEDLADVGLETRREGDTLVLAADHPDDGWLPSFGTNSEVNLDLAVPESLSAVEAGTTNGDVEAEGLDADLDSETTNGDIDVRDHRRAATAVTTNGEVSLRLDEGADVTAESTNGDIEVVTPASMAAQFSLETTNGDVSVEGVDGLSVSDTDSLETVTGDGTHEVRCETTNGDITVRN